MTTGGVIRPLKTGGCSLCRASEQNVGKRRCRHILDGAQFNVVQEQHINFIDISGMLDNKQTNFSISATEKDISTYIKQLSVGLNNNDKQNILNILRDED